MKNSDALKSMLAHLDGKGYKAYKDLEGAYDFGEFVLWMDHVQGDPFGAPSRVRVAVDQKQAGFSPECYHPRIRAIALQDFLTRKFGEVIRTVVKGGRGIGGSGRMSIDRPGQEVLERTCCTVNQEKVEVRFTMGLPAAGRTILGRQAADMFFQELPKLIHESLLSKNLPAAELQPHIQVVEDQEAIREELPGHLDGRPVEEPVGHGHVAVRIHVVESDQVPAAQVSAGAVVQHQEFPTQVG